MKPLFNKIKVTRPKTNTFDLSHERKLSCNMGDLIPILCNEIVPGDRFRVNNEVLLRMAPMLAPIMHRVNLSIHYFFVPNRLLWDEWESFITGGVDGTEVPVHPHMVANALNAGYFNILGNVADYLGVPQLGFTSGTPTKVNALPFRAYQLIWDEYYRDQNLQDPTGFSKYSGACSQAETELLTTLRKRCWEKDYFTSALPWAQRGGEVLIPLGANVEYSDIATIHGSSINQPQLTGAVGSHAPLEMDEDGHANVYIDPNRQNIGIHNIDSIENGTYTINDLRRATKLQEWLEKNARSGARYIEQIFAHFGVKSSDARLQRPEYLGGTKQPIIISEVLSMQDSASRPQGDMAGHGISAAGNSGFTKYFEEHGFIMGVMSILPRTAYFQGLPKMFSRSDKFDYYFPEFANIGEQEVLNKEVYVADSAYTLPGHTVPYNDEVFGYQSRFAEYKFQNSTIHGDFRSNLKFWHLGREFEDAPQLNEDFVKSNPATRIFAVEEENIHKLWVQIFNDVKAIRPMPVFGVPSF